MWFNLGPFYTNINIGLASLGLVGMFRQISFIFGSIISGTFADIGRPLEKQFKCELLILINSILLFSLMNLKSEYTPMIIPYWVIFRFFMAGISFVLGFKIISSQGKGQGNSSIVHLLTTQGATLFAPTIATGFSLTHDYSFHLAILLDMITSFAFVGFLYSKKDSKIDIQLESGEKKNILKELYQTATKIWEAKYRTMMGYQIIALISFSCYVVFVMDLSLKQTHFDSSTAYPLFSVVYGLALWIIGTIVRKFDFNNQYLIIGPILLLFSAYNLDWFYLNIYSMVSMFLIYVTAFWLILHSSNKAILDLAPENETGKVRASMVFYLATIFGLGEGLAGQMFQMGYGFDYVYSIRFFGAIGLLIVITFIKYRSDFNKKLHLQKAN